MGTKQVGVIQHFHQGQKQMPVEKKFGLCVKGIVFTASS